MSKRELAKIHEDCQVNYEHFWRHTCLAAWLEILVIVVIAFQGMSIWNGDIGRFHHDTFDPEYHEYLMHAHKVLSGEDHPLKEYHASERYISRGHAHHHTRLERLILDHPQAELLGVLIGLFAASMVCIGFRYLFAYFQKTLSRTYLISWVLGFEIFFHLCSGILWAWLIVNHGLSPWIFLAFVVECTLLMLCVASMYIVDLLRGACFRVAQLSSTCNIHVMQNSDAGSFDQGSINTKKTWAGKVDWILGFILSAQTEFKCLKEKKN